MTRISQVVAVLGQVYPEISGPPTTGLLVVDGMIRGYGRAASAAAAAGVPTIRLRGDSIAQPAFRDPHLHILAMAAARISVDCRAEIAPTLRDVLGLIQEAAAFRQPGSWIRAANFDDALVAEQRHPRLDELDAAAPDRPLLLRHRTGHGVMVNSTGALILRRESHVAVPAGELLAPEVIPDGITQLPRHRLEDAVKQESVSMAASGIVAFGDATPANDVRRLELLSRFVESGVISQDVVFMPGIDHLDELVERGARFQQRLKHAVCGHVKIVPDGDDTRLAEQVAHARRHRWAVAVHVLDAAELDAAIRALSASAPLPGVPDRIEHLAICLPDQLQAVRRIGSAVVSNPAFLAARSRKYVSQVSELEREWLYPVRGLIARGVTVAAASDGPVAPTHPLLSVSGAVHRGDGHSVFGGAERVDAVTALGMVTRAAGLVMTGSSSSLKVAAAADFVILDRDPRQIGNASIRDVSVLATFKSGHPIYADDRLSTDLNIGPRFPRRGWPEQKAVELSRD